MSMPLADIKTIEEMNFNAWPSLMSVHLDGWLVRQTGGISRRVNSVNALGPGRLTLLERIERSEELFRHWQQRSVFRITPLVEPELEGLLAERGYSVEAPTFVMSADVQALEADARVKISEVFEPAWAAASAQMRGLSSDEAAILSAQHRAIAVPTLWASVNPGDKATGIGVAAIERGWAGLHGIHVGKNERRRGLARAISATLLSRAHALGARNAWLQVEQANSAAIPLYKDLGFEVAWTYWHRVKKR